MIKTKRIAGKRTTEQGKENKHPAKLFARPLKKYSFSTLENLIKQAKKSKNKPQLKKYRSLYRQKLHAWSASWQAGRAKLLANQQKRRLRKQAQLLAQQAKQATKLQKKTRLKEIYSYFRSELNKQAKKDSPYFTAHLDLPPHLAKGLKKKQKQHPDYDFYSEFRRPPYLSYRLNKQGSSYLLKQTRQAYQEELSDQASQLRYLKDKIGSRTPKINFFSKKEQFKYFFPEKGEHKEFWRRKKEFVAERQQILNEIQGQQITNRPTLLSLYKRLYEKSPWRLRDRFLITTSHPVQSYGMDELWKKYYHNNPFTATKKYYWQALMRWQNSLEREGEEVPESEIELDRYGMPKFKEGWVIALDSKKPGRMWSVYRNVPTWKEQVKRKVHELAQEQYYLEEGTALEIQTWKLKKDKALCWVEAMGMGNCSANQGTSAWFCLFCLLYGEYHPPVLPKHCPWLYSYKTWLCGQTQHADANKQWHFSVEGERVREKIRGGDWGGCHIGVFEKKRRIKGKLRKKNWILPG